MFTMYLILNMYLQTKDAYLTFCVKSIVILKMNYEHNMKKISNFFTTDPFLHKVINEREDNANRVYLVQLNKYLFKYTCVDDITNIQTNTKYINVINNLTE